MNANDDKEARAARNAAIRSTTAIGLSSADFNAAESELAAKWGKEPVPNDVFWSLANRQVGLTQDWHELSGLYRQMALVAHREKRSPLQLLREANNAEVHHLQATGAEFEVVGVRAIANVCCDGCAALDRRSFGFSDALDQLPPEDCSRAFCNCGWVAAV